MQREPNASLYAWLAVAAGAVGSLMATLDISIVNASLPTIQGEIGATSSEATWIATAYLVAEIIIIPLSGWLERVFGLRRFLLIASLLFTIFSVMCGLSGNLQTMIVGRIGQGFTGGAMIPTAMTIIATRLPRHQQPIGTAMFGSTVILGPLLGPLIGGWLTEHLSWHYSFFVNVPVCAMLMALLILGLQPAEPEWEELTDADWMGIAGLILGLGGLTVVLEEGHRELWFQSALIWQLTGVTALGFGLLIAGQVFARRPVINLGLLLRREFFAVFVMALVIGVVLYGISFVIPQFLAALAGYDALQAGQVVFLSGVPALMMMPIVPILIARLDLRLAVAAGFAVMAASCWFDTSLTAASTGEAFTGSQLLRGVGQLLSMMFLNQAAIAAVPPEDAADASGLFNAARNLGGSIGLALLATLQDSRFEFHRWRLHSTLQANSDTIQAWVHQQVLQFGGGPEGMVAALRSIDGMVSRQALAMAYADDFAVMVYAILFTLPLVLLLKPLPKGAHTMAMH
ncbi:MAG: multidrug efflux MFS transporter [Sphingomonadales bacterium]|nr:multidrug efflux MFS transporter [Sphingomonadales bacterium]MDE2568511.1 multidrug efflux MFS transporter [Sphingomonadales bacterium]